MRGEEITTVLRVTNRVHCEPQLADSEIVDVARSSGRYARGEQPQAEQNTPRASDDDWPAPRPLPGELPPVEPFDPALLPESLRRVAADASERMQVPMDFPAAALVLCLAGAVSRRATIQPKAQDTTWIVVPNLWGGIVAPPGYLKSPVIHNATLPLQRIQALWRQEHEAAFESFHEEQEQAELRKTAWKEQYKAAIKAGKAPPIRPDDSLREPTPKRLILNDATFEAMHQTMSENPAGIFVIRDELTGWLAQLDRKGREGEREFALSAWNGDTSFTLDRIERGTIHVEACCMSMLGGIQPGRLRSYLTDAAIRDNPNNDGLLQRFQVLVWPDASPEWTYVDRAPDAEAIHQAKCVFEKLVALDPENPLRLRFDRDAQALFVEWLAELEAKVRGGELHPALTSHLSKYRSLMPSLALLFALWDGFARNKEPESVALPFARLAAAWCAYLESHARRVYAGLVSPQVRAARDLGEKIKRRSVGAEGVFTLRDVYNAGWSGLDSPESAKAAIAVLEDAGWVRDITEPPGPSGGRPSLRYQINPRIWA